MAQPPNLTYIKKINTAILLPTLRVGYCSLKTSLEV